MDRCALCPGVNNCVPPQIPDCNIYTLFVGEAPGYDENKALRPFVGKTGQELKGGYFPLAGIREHEAYITNAVKCLPISSKGKLDLNKEKDKALLLCCAETHLYSEIEEIKPKLLVLMGAFACYAVDPAISLDLHHGIPFMTRLGIMAFPMFHPASGMHEPKKMLQIRTDWIRLKQYFREYLRIAVDEYPNPDYREVENEVELGTFEMMPDKPIACDTESSRSKGPYCLTYSQEPGVGRLIRAERTDLLEAFQDILKHWTGPILFHNWLYDKTVVEKMGLKFPNKLIRDTMVRSFHLGNLPQGLKALAFRELGMEMQDFEDLVKPYSTNHILTYFRAAYDLEWPKPPSQMIMQDDGTLKKYQPHRFSTKLKTFFTLLKKDPEKDVFKMWDNWEEHQHDMEDQLGPYPGLDIDHAPFDKVLKYACRDADSTIRLWHVLERMKKAVRKGPQEQWRDYGRAR